MVCRPNRPTPPRLFGLPLLHHQPRHPQPQPHRRRHPHRHRQRPQLPRQRARRTHRPANALPPPACRTTKPRRLANPHRRPARAKPQPQPDFRVEPHPTAQHHPHPAPTARPHPQPNPRCRPPPHRRPSPRPRHPQHSKNLDTARHHQLLGQPHRRRPRRATAPTVPPRPPARQRAARHRRHHHPAVFRLPAARAHQPLLRIRRRTRPNPPPAPTATRQPLPPHPHHPRRALPLRHPRLATRPSLPPCQRPQPTLYRAQQPDQRPRWRKAHRSLCRPRHPPSPRPVFRLPLPARQHHPAAALHPLARTHVHPIRKCPCRAQHRPMRQPPIPLRPTNRTARQPHRPPPSPATRLRQPTRPQPRTRHTKNPHAAAPHHIGSLKPQMEWRRLVVNGNVLTMPNRISGCLIAQAIGSLKPSQTQVGQAFMPDAVMLWRIK